MHWLLTGIAVAATGLPPAMEPAERVTYVTEDGWSNHLLHYPGTGRPVLLVHGMGVNHYNWDFRPEISLAHTLQEQGWDVWIVELRGDPGSLPHDSRDRHRFDFDDHARYDVPAAVDKVLAVTGHDDLIWIGHSMGGMLLYTTLATRPETIAAGVAVCSPVTFETRRAQHKAAARLGPLLTGDGVLRRRGLARTAASVAPLLAVKRLANPHNMEIPMLRGLAHHAAVDLPRPLAHQATRWAHTGRLVRRDGSDWLTDLDGVDTPLLVLGAPRDRLVPAPNVEAACGMFSDCTYLELGRSLGLSRDYGHVDPMIGRDARDEVYPLITEWLRTATR